MLKVVMLLLTLAISTFFIHVPSVGSVGFILNHEVRLNYNQYFWAIGEHLGWIIMSLLIWDYTDEYKDLCLLFVFIQLMDALAFILAYDDPLKDYMITWNIAKTLIFGAAIGYKQWRK